MSSYASCDSVFVIGIAIDLQKILKVPLEGGGSDPNFLVVSGGSPDNAFDRTLAIQLFGHDLIR